MPKSLLILGAGGHGQVVREVALSLRSAAGDPVYSQVDFLDDAAPGVVGTLKDVASVGLRYDEVFVGIGNNKLRRTLQQQLQALGFLVPVLVDPRAYVSPSAILKAGCIVEPMALVNAHTVLEEGCLVSVGAIVDHDVVMGAFSHVNAGAICKAGSRLESGRRVETGEIVLGY